MVKSSIYLTSIAFVLLHLSSLSAQTIHQDYVDGELFVRTHSALSPMMFGANKKLDIRIFGCLSTLDVRLSLPCLTTSK